MVVKIVADIDIDMYDRDLLLDKIKHIPASRNDKGILKKHNTGVYLQPIPHNPLTGISNIEYEEAENRGYFKIDFLNVSAYKDVKDEAHLEKLLAMAPVWELLYEKDICDQLLHINGYHGLLNQLKPKSIEELAMVLALIRPGKKHLINMCASSGFSSIDGEIWTKTADYSFKKAHAISYATLIIMQLNLLVEKINLSS